MRLKGIAVALFLSLSAMSCSSNKTVETKTVKVETPNKTTQAVAENKGEYYAILHFDKGTQRLSEASKKDLKDFVVSAQREGRPIDDIKILAWADKEYPAAGAKLTNHDIKIAAERSKSIEKYLKEDLNTSGSYETYNMAKRPNKVSEFLHGDDYKTKRIFERSGAAPSGSDMQAFMNSKASKALIMVDYKDE